MYESIFARLSAVERSHRGWQARCPAHDDHSPSLSLAFGNQGQLLLYCHAGCRLESILRALHIRAGELFPDGPAFDLTEPHRVALSILRAQQAKWQAGGNDEAQTWAVIRHARTVATRLGNRDESWELLEQAAALELLMLNA